MRSNSKRYYVNDVNAGNTLESARPGGVQMIMDSLLYWVNELHVDGFLV